MRVVVSIILFILFVSSEAEWGTPERKKVKLKDVDVLTLYYGKMTNGRRSSPVPQLECQNEGTAPCTAFKPKVVQCMNKGSDGFDIQWECKSDMDNAYRFGQIEVSCEGYDYPEDPHILHGSCGLRYSIDYTEEGHTKKNHQHNHYSPKSKSTMSSIMADLVVYIGIGLMVYAFYWTCTRSGRNAREDAYSTTNDDYPAGGGGGGGGGYGWFGGGNQQPPSYSSHRYQNDASCRNRNNTGGSGMGGFWTGATTGGLLGFMFGNRGGGTGYGYGGRGYGFGGGGYAPSVGVFFSGGGGAGSSSSGTRSASGFGGTSRR